MTVLYLLLSCLVGGSLAATSADLRPYNTTAALMFASTDSNADLILQRTELEQYVKNFDFNSDGDIERHEYVCMLTKSNANLVYVSHAIYDDYDVNHDHHLKKEDFDAFFMKMDQDHDKEVTSSEYVSYWTKLLSDTEGYSLQGNKHPAHTDKYCEKHNIQ